MPESPSPTTRENAKFKVSELDDRLENGPIEERGCTDILCCLLFIAFWVGLVFVGITAYASGATNAKYMAALYDSDGFPCGMSGTLPNASNFNASTSFDYTAYPYLYFPIPVPGKTNRRVCVKSCPTIPLTGSSLPSSLDCKTNSYVTSCSSSTGINLDYLSLFTDMNVSLVSNKTFVIYNTTTYLDELCFPSDLAFWSCSSCTTWVSSYLSSSSIVQEWVSDMSLTWPLLFAVLGIAFVIGFIFMIIMRYFSGIITWLMIWSYVIALAVLGGLCYYKYQLLTTSSGLAAATTNTNSTNASNAISGSNSDTTTSETLYIFAIIFWVVDGISLLVLCCIYHKINIVIAVLKAGADYMKQVPTALLVPPLLTLVVVAFFAYWIAAFICLFASGAAFVNDSLPFTSVSWSDSTYYLMIYHGFGLLWNLAFFMAFCQFVLASSCAIWYYSQGPDGQEASMTVSRSFWRGVRYHLGSIAFGSLIIAIIEAVRLVMFYIHKQLKDAGVTESNKFIEYAMKCIHCCLDCFERFIQFINKNAYIQIAVRGSNFCTAAKDSFFLILGNPALFAIMGGLGGIFLFVGQIFITCATVCIGYAMVINIYSSSLYSPVMPCVFYFFIAYAVGAFFLSVYSMACDTILQCFLIDEELQKSKGRQPKHCPEPLREMFEKMEQKPQADTKVVPL